MTDYKVYKSGIVNGSLKDVWSRIGDFNGLTSWHPGMKSSEIVQAGEFFSETSIVRKLVTLDGAVIYEKLLELSENDENIKFCKYCILDSPMPITGYVATLAVKTITEEPGKVYFEWSSVFTSEHAHMAAAIGENVYVAGLRNLQAIMNAAV